jgi:hypothetical protein
MEKELVRKLEQALRYMLHLCCSIGELGWEEVVVLEVVVLGVVVLEVVVLEVVEWIGARM